MPSSLDTTVTDAFLSVYLCDLCSIPHREEYHRFERKNKPNADSLMLCLQRVESPTFSWNGVAQCIRAMPTRRNSLTAGAA